MAAKTKTEVLEAIGKFLRYHDSLGIKEYPRSAELAGFLVGDQENRRPPGQAGRPAPRTREDSTDASGPKHFLDSGPPTKTTLQEVRQELGDCCRCSLRETGAGIIFGRGPAGAKLMIVADAPGPDDDRQNEPFQGAAGELLDKMLAAIDMSRDEVYLTTLVKCFPGPQARPREEDVKICLPFLLRQIQIIRPAVLCLMGLLAAQTILRSRKSLFQLRGRFYNFNDLCTPPLDEAILIMPTMPPSLLLENNDLKKASWKDLQMIQKKLEET